MEFLFGLIILILDIWAIVNVIQSRAGGLAKVIWFLVILGRGSADGKSVTPVAVRQAAGIFQDAGRVATLLVCSDPPPHNLEAFVGKEKQRFPNCRPFRETIIPIIEAIMIGTQMQQGVAFISRGRKIVTSE